MKIEQILKEYSLFRRNMGIPIDRKVLYTFWEEDILGRIDFKNINVEKIRNTCSKRKIQIAKESIKYILVFNWVKFIAISGSIASGFVKEDDDIDIFIVLKNDRAWIYRAIILFRNIFHKRIRVGDRKTGVKDKLCINFIAEERSLCLDSDIFNLNEIVSLIPLYRKEYLKVLLGHNEWLFDKYSVSKKVLGIKKGESFDRKENKGNLFFSILNMISFLLQLLYMLVTGHNPDIKRLRMNYRKGRIEFFPKDFKMKKIDFLKDR